MSAATTATGAAGCQSLTDQLARGSPLAAPLKAHADACADCRALVRASEALGPPEAWPAPPMPAMLAGLPRDAVAPYNAWVRAVPAALALVVPLLLGLALKPATPWGPAGVAMASAWLLVGLGGLVLALRRGAVGLGAPDASLVLGVGAAAVVFVLGSYGWSDAGADVADGLAHAPTCGSVSVGVSLLGLVAWLYSARRTAVAHAGLTGALCGAAGAMGAVLCLHAVCASRDLFHLWASHGAGLLVATVLGAVAGRRMLAP